MISYVTGGNVALPEGDARRHRRRPERAAGQLQQGHGLGRAGADTIRARGGQDKGQRAELARFVEAVLAGAAMPIPLESLVATTRATIAVRDSLLSGKPERV